jgi:hypothetical protein
MEPLIKTATIHAALSATMVSMNPVVAVFQMIVQQVKRRVQTTIRQVINKHAATAFGETKKLVRTTILAIRLEQIVAAVSMVPSNVPEPRYRPVQLVPGTVAKHVKRRQVEQRHVPAMVIVDIIVMTAIQITAKSAV